MIRVSIKYSQFRDCQMPQFRTSSTGASGAAATPAARTPAARTPAARTPAANLIAATTSRFSAAGAAITALVSAHAHAESAAPVDEDRLQSIEVTGTAIHTAQDISQSADTVDKKALAEQNLALVQDALRNVPGITLNAGEGGSHGDS